MTDTGQVSCVPELIAPGPVRAAVEPARHLRALSVPAQLALHRALQACPAGSATASELAASVGLTVPAARRHLRALHAAGLLELDSTTRPACYRPVWSASRHLADSLHSPLLDRLDATPSGQPAPAAVSSELRLTLLSRVAEQVGDGVALIDPDGWLLYANPAFAAMHGYPHQQLRGRHYTAFYPPDGNQRALAELIAGAREHGTAHGETDRLRADGSTFPAAVTLSLLRDDAGDPLGRVLSVRDITARRRLEQQLHDQALHDPLTGLPNRRLLLDRLNAALTTAARTGRPVSVLFADLDGFKQVNDRHGHDTGDQLLRQVARRLSAALRDQDTLARLGGDEFVAVLPDTDQATAHSIAQRLRAALHPPITLAGHPVPVDHSMSLSIGLSIGIATDHSGPPMRLLAAADAAMYRDKTTRPAPHLPHQPHPTPAHAAPHVAAHAAARASSQACANS